MCHPPFKISLNGAKVPLGGTDIAARLVIRRPVDWGGSKVKNWKWTINLKVLLGIIGALVFLI